MTSHITDKIIWIFTILALLAYTIAVMLGMEYLVDGNHYLAIGITIVGSLILSICVWEMCCSKSSRNKRRDLPLGILAAIIAFSILVIGSWPITVFLNAYDNKAELEGLVHDTSNYAVSVDSLYNQYAKDRIACYKLYLDSMKVAPNEKNQCIRSLERRLLSSANDSIHHKRQEWLASLPDADVWNLSTAKNLHDVFLAAEKWIGEYKEVSSIIYKGEHATYFECEDFTKSAYDEYENFISLRKPNTRSIICAIVCILLIFVTYFFVRRPKSRFASRR